MEQSDRLTFFGLIAGAVIVVLTVQSVNEPSVTAELSFLGYRGERAVVEVVVREQNWWKSKVTAREEFWLAPGESSRNQGYGHRRFCGPGMQTARVWLTHDGMRGVSRVVVSREGNVVFDEWLAVPVEPMDIGNTEVPAPEEWVEVPGRDVDMECASPDRPSTVRS